MIRRTNILVQFLSPDKSHVFINSYRRLMCVKANGRRETLQPSLLPSISDERQELLQKTFERKLPWTDMETQYYDSVSVSLALTLQSGSISGGSRICKRGPRSSAAGASIEAPKAPRGWQNFVDFRSKNTDF